MAQEQPGQFTAQPDPVQLRVESLRLTGLTAGILLLASTLRSGGSPEASRHAAHFAWFMLFLAIWGSGYALLRLPDAGVLADPEKRRNALRFIDSLRWGAFLALTAGAGATMVWLVMIT